MRKLLAAYIAQAEVQITDEVGEGHILHPINDEQVVSRIVDFFLQRQLYIADGHPGGRRGCERSTRAPPFTAWTCGG